MINGIKPREVKMILDDMKYIAKDLASVPLELADRFARVPGIRAMVRHERCNGCTACVRKGFCRFGAIEMNDKKANVDVERCRGCGRCTHLCKRDAFTLEVRPPRVVTDTLRRIDDRITGLMK